MPPTEILSLDEFGSLSNEAGLQSVQLTLPPWHPRGERAREGSKAITASRSRGRLTRAGALPPNTDADLPRKRLTCVPVTESRRKRVGAGLPGQSGPMELKHGGSNVPVKCQGWLGVFALSCRQMNVSVSQR